MQLVRHTNLLDAIDPNRTIEKAKEIFNTEKPTHKQIKETSEKLVEHACMPFDNPSFRNLLIDIKKKNEQIIDTISKDAVIFSGFDDKAKERAKTIVDTFRRFIQENKDELTALQIIYSKPYSKRHLTYEAIKELAESIQRPPYHLTTETLWKAYEQLERSKVRGAGSQKLLTDIISLIRFELGKTDVIEPFSILVERRFRDWLEKQKSMGRTFSPE